MDTKVVLVALGNPSGPSAELLRRGRRGELTLVASVTLFIEYEAVLTRPEHLAASGLSRSDVLKVLDTMASFVEPVQIRYLWRPMLKDPNDDMVLETAVNGRADALVTVNLGDFDPVRSPVRTLRPDAARSLEEPL